MYLKDGSTSRSMSNVNLIVIKDRQLHVQTVHFREAMKLLAQPLSAKGSDVDAGYLLIDFDSQTILSRQSAFALARVPISKQFTVLEM